MNEPATIREIFENAKTIAVVGLSDQPSRASLGVSRYMQRQGFKIVPINPNIREVLGERSYPDLQSAVAAGNSIDLVNVFRAPRHVPAIVDEAIRLKIPYLWLQMGVCHEEAAKRAEAAGIKVAMDMCIYQTHAAYRA